MSNALSGVRADHRYSYRDLEHFAKHVRRSLGWPEDQRVDTLGLFENLDDITIVQSDGTKIPLRGGVVSLEGSEGYTRYEPQRHMIEILASEETYQRLEGGHPRAGYFVAHELGHCILHTDQLVRLAQMPSQQQAAFHRGRADHKPYEDTEWQANGFASALLMPARAMRALEEAHGKLTPRLMVEHFGVSEEAGGYRIDLYSNRGCELLG